MSEDLSFYHMPLTTVFERSRAVSLSAEQIDFYEKNGYLTGVRILDEEQTDELKTELERISKPDVDGLELFYEYHQNESNDPGSSLFHALGAWRVSPVFHDLIFCRSFVSAAAQLVDGPVRFWHDQIFSKPARHGGVVAWHQDYSYWTRTKPIAHLTCWIALEDATEKNGCVHYVPGSHRWNLLPRNYLAKDMEAVFACLTPEQKAEFKPVPAILKKGEANFHHPMMLHGSYENRSAKPRHGAVINVFRDGVCSDSDEPLLDGVPVIPKGEKIEGRFFPLLAGADFGQLSV